VGEHAVHLFGGAAEEEEAVEEAEGGGGDVDPGAAEGLDVVDLVVDLVDQRLPVSHLGAEREEVGGGGDVAVEEGIEVEGGGVAVERDGVLGGCLGACVGKKLRN